jgi:predicted ATPase/DNA-binding SARP family transcriptional activator
MTVVLSLFGAPTIERGGVARALECERRTQLLVYLAIKRTWVGRAEIAALLWPELDTKLAYTNLRKALHRLQTLPGGDRVESQGSALRFEARTDVHAFEEALREQRVAEALALRRGDLLVGFDDDANDAWSGWLGFERDRLRAAWRSAAQQYLSGDVNATGAIDHAARLLDDDPLDEAALRLYVEWLVRAGQAARARQAYNDFVTRLRDELGLEPGAELRALHDTLRGGPAATVATSSTSPRSDDGFVGRAVEMRRIAALLADNECRLLCLTGPGGVGKTTLARHVLDELAPGYADGAVFVPLEDLSSPSEIGGRITQELAIALKGRTEPMEQVIEALRPRRMLMVLDNFEHLVDGARLLERLLSNCPGVKLLVTSRVRLALSKEWLLPIEGLPCPDEEDRDRIEAFDAARLFVRAAHRVHPELVAAAESSAIVDICQQVQGLPLALELAASWTRVLSCEDIAAELRQGTELLHAVDAARPARHSSMEVVFDHSWRLLSDVERRALARLSVFAGGFSAESARAVTGARLPVLGALADKSLLLKGQARLHLHPLVQQLAAERLDGSQAGAEAAAMHAAYFHRLLAQLKPAVASGDRAALNRIEEEFENCRRAWNWSLEHGEADALARSSSTLLDYWDYRGRFEEGLALLRKAVEAPIAQADTALQALLLSRAAHLEYRLDRYGDAEAKARRVLGMTRVGGDRAARVQALNVLATCAYQLGRWEDARRYFKQRLDSASSEEQAHSLAVTLDHFALIEKRLGNYDEALRLALQSLEQHRRLGDSAGEALCLNNLGSLELEMNQNDAAAAHLRQGLAICERDGLVNTRGLILTNLADVAIASGDLAAAEACAHQAIEIATAVGNRLVSTSMQLLLVSIALQRGDLAAARLALAAGLGAAIELASPPMMLESVVRFAALLTVQGEPLGARRVLAIAAAQPATTQLIRGAIRAQAARLPEAAKMDPVEGSSMAFDELVRRIVAEASIAHAPLIATLRSTP